MIRTSLSIAWTALLTVLTPFPSAAEMLEVNGARLHYVDEGQGSPIVFVHGLLGDVRVWSGLRNEIAQDHRFLAYDQRYHGQSTWDDAGGSFTIESHTSDLISFVDALAAGPVTLFAWSYGGQIGLQAIRQRPDLFSAAIFYEPDVDSLQAGLPGASAVAAEFYSALGPAISEFGKGDLPQASIELVRAVFHQNADQSVPLTQALDAIWRDNSRTLPFAFSLVYPELSCDDIGNVSVPTLVIQGSGSWAHQSMASEALARCLPQAVVLTMEGVSHDGPLRSPNEVATIIASFASIFEE